MALTFPTVPMTGKNGEVYMNSGDGAKLTSAVMTKQASYTYDGEVLANRVYLLGTGKTLINSRPAIAPRIDIDGIVDGLEVEPGTANDTVNVSVGSIMVDGVLTAVDSSESPLSVTRPAATQGAWVAISVVKSTGAVKVTKGTDTSDAGGKTGLLDTYGAEAGKRPLIATDELLIALIQLTNGAAKVLTTEIFYTDREFADIEAEILPNIGGVKITTALVALHTGAVAREVKFTGYYLDNIMTKIATAKKWGLTPGNNTVSDTTMGRLYSSTEIGSWAFNFEQLSTDGKVINNVLSRQGHCAVKLVYPNGGYWQGVGTIVPNFSCDPGSFLPITVSGSLLDTPVGG
jgi:hypothetical protein